ncbi:MAG: hypothetical protein AB1896_07890, partial [Thermodesulfobacteriota bacterium]
MSSTVNYTGPRLMMASFWTQAAQSFWGASKKDEGTDSLLNFLADRQDVQVDLCLEKVGDQVTQDLAAVTAHYLADRPELSEDYVLVLIRDALGGWEARAYRREDLAAGLEGEEKEKVLAALEKNRLLYNTTTAGLPEPSTDEGLIGLAEEVQSFLDNNEKLLNILVREGAL